VSQQVAVLAGKRVLVPVTAQRRDLAVRLAAHGMRVDEAEFIAIDPPSDVAALSAATERWCAGDYAWMAVTSRNAVLALHHEAQAAGLSLADPQPAARVASVGEATLALCAQVGLDVTLVPSTRHNAAGLVADFPPGSGRVLAPLGNLASPVLGRGLERKGWEVDAVEAYRTVDGAGLTRTQRQDLADGALDAVILTSGSVATRLAQSCSHVSSETMVVAIGATTAASAKAAGLAVHAVAALPSYDSIVEALCAALASTPAPEETS
jgi:uroporphyrinogen-III synthase